MLDIDGVLANESRQILKWAFQKYGIGPGDVPYTGTNVRVYKGLNGLSKKDEKKIRQDPEFYKTMKAFEGAGNFTRQLSLWADIHIVTARHEYPAIQQDTMTWLEENNIEFLTLSFIPAKKKESYCKKYGMNLAFEDDPYTIDAICKIIPVIGILWPYNEGLDDKAMFAENYYEAVEKTASLIGVSGPLKYPQSTKRISGQ
jgi:5'(3')-deoxyribonucleotidase